MNLKYFFVGIVLVLFIANVILFAVLLRANSFTANVAVDSTFNIPIKTVVPIKTTVNVPVTIPIVGQQVTIAVPIDTQVTINTTVQVPIKATIPVEVKIIDF